MYYECYSRVIKGEGGKLIDMTLISVTSAMKFSEE
jgi:hypothetical protein